MTVLFLAARHPAPAQLIKFLREGISGAHLAVEVINEMLDSNDWRSLDKIAPLGKELAELARAADELRAALVLEVKLAAREQDQDGAA